MKKQLIVGMVVVASLASFNAQAAGTTKGFREYISDYMTKLENYKKNVRENKTLAAGLETAEALKEQDRVMDDLGLNASEKSALKSAIQAGKAQKVDVLATLNTLAAAKKAVAGKADADSKSVASYVDAAVRLMGNADLVALKTSSSFLGKDFADTSSALKKLVSMAEKPLTYDVAERDAYTAALKKADELSGTADSFEAALVQGIMQTAKNEQGKPGVTKEKALEIIRKLLKCV